MNLCYLLNPLESDADKSDKDHSESESTSTPASTDKVKNSSSTNIHPRNIEDRVSSAGDSVISSAANRTDNKSRDLQCQPDYFNPFDQSSSDLIQELKPLPRSGANRDDSTAISGTPLSWDYNNHGMESVGAKRKQNRSIKQSWDPLNAGNLTSDSYSSGSNNSNSIDDDEGGGTDRASNSTVLSENQCHGDSFKRGKKSPDPKDAEVDPVLQPDLERTVDGTFRCNWARCGKDFSVASRLSAHFRIHLGKPPYLCGYKGCEKSFHTSSSLSHHRVVHTDQGLRPYVCRYDRCGATYTQLARLITHQRTTHSGSILFLSPEAAMITSPSPASLFASSPPTKESIYTATGDQPIQEHPFNSSHTQPENDPQGRSVLLIDGDYQDEKETEMYSRDEASLTTAGFSTLATIRDQSSPWLSSDSTAPRARMDYRSHPGPYDDCRYYPRLPQPTNADHYQQPLLQRWPSNQPSVYPGEGYGRHSQGASPSDQEHNANCDRRRHFQGFTFLAQPLCPEQDRHPQTGVGNQQSPSDNTEGYYHRERGYFDSL